MAALTFPNSPTDGQTVTINGTTYIYRLDISAWDLLFNAPPNHALSHGIDGGDPVTIDTSQVTGLDAELVQSGQYGAAGSVLQNLPHRVLTAETKMKEAVLWFDANHSSSSNQVIENLGWGGRALNPRLGSSINVDSEDPKYFDYTGLAYVYVPGRAGNYISVPDSSELDIAGNIDIRVKVALDTWQTPSATQRIIGKYGAEENRTFLLNYTTGQNLQLIWYSTSITQHIATSTAALSTSNGVPKWLRVTVLVNNGSGGTNVNFYTSDDGITWTAVGSTVTIASITGFFNSTAPIEIGDVSSTSSPMAGKIFNIEINNGINGVPVLKMDTSHAPTGSTTSCTCLTGQTATVNRSSSGPKTVVVTSPGWLLGNGDFLEVRERWMEHLGSNFAFFPGIEGNYLYVVDAAPLDITGNIDIRAQIALDDWTPTTEATIISKATTPTTRSYKISISTTGAIKLSWSEDGATWISKTSTLTVPSLGVQNRDIKWIRATLDADNSLGQNEVRFYTADDGFTWTQLGTTVVSTGATSIYSGNSPVQIGCEETVLNPMLGKVFVAQILADVEGSTVLRIDVPTDIATTDGNVNSFTATTGQTVQVSRSGADLRTAIITYSGYLQPNSEEIIPANYSLLDFGSSESFTLFAVVRAFATEPTDARIISKEYISASDSSYQLSWGSNGKPFGEISDGTVTATTANSGAGRGSYDYGNVGVFALVVDKDAYELIEYGNGAEVYTASILTVGELSNFGVFRVGANSYTSPVADYSDMEVVSVAVFRKALTPEDVKMISNYYLGRVA